jgi:hypothetical protein
MAAGGVAVPTTRAIQIVPAILILNSRLYSDETERHLCVCDQRILGLEMTTEDLFPDSPIRGE